MKQLTPDDQWLTGGLEPDVIAEAHLDAASIFAGVQRFATDARTGSAASAISWPASERRQ